MSNTHTLLVFNPAALPEFDGRTEQFEAWEKNPFMGIEVVGWYEDMEDVDAEITRMMGDNNNLKFHIT